MTRVKICGLTNLDDALAAAEAGADLLGFNFVESSPRYVDPDRATALVAGLRARGVGLPCVGVVAGRPLPEVRALVAQCGLDLIQLHGAESVDVAAALYPRVIVARQVTGPASLAGLGDYPAYAYLLDARGAGGREARGRPWDWTLLRTACIPGRVIVAGGLTPENVAGAVRQARPWGVDVASGVETRAGRKDRAAVVRFIRTVREVDGGSGSDDGDNELA